MGPLQATSSAGFVQTSERRKESCFSVKQVRDGSTSAAQRLARLREQPGQWRWGPASLLLQRVQNLLKHRSPAKGVPCCRADERAGPAPGVAPVERTSLRRRQVAEVVE